MSLPDVTALQNQSQYQRLAELSHKDLIPFITEHYWKQKSWVTWAHYLISLAIFLSWMFAGFQDDLSIDQWLSQFGYAVLGFIVLIPLHEWIHGMVYKLAGAKDVRYSISLRQMYAYAIAHLYVANRTVFIWVALAPFILINTLLILASVWLPEYRFFFLGLLLLHTSGTSGDFSLLNYFWLKRHQDVFTYDDAETHKSYFYARIDPISDSTETQELNHAES